ncbi:MAG: hypothetical protein AAB497_02815 [Patescibacteria group bacterium]
MKSGRKHTKTLSYRQRRVVDLWIAGGRKNKARAIRAASYSEAVARQPHKVFDSPVVQRELELRGLGKKGIENSYAPKKEIEVQEEVNMKQEPVFDPLELSIGQIGWLRRKLAELPDVSPVSPPRMTQEEIPSYTPQGIGVDIFSAEAKEQYGGSALSFSSM